VIRIVRGLVPALLLLLLLTPAAAARTAVGTVAPRGDGSVDLVLTVDHGCAGAATVALETTLPERAVVVAVQDPGGWEHRVDDRVVRWSGGPLRPMDRERFTVTVRLDAEPGSVVTLPSVQRCADGAEVAWTATEDGADRPAPRFVATDATVDPALRPAPADTDSGGAGPVAVAVTVAACGLLGLALGLVARRAAGSAAGRPALAATEQADPLHPSGDDGEPVARAPGEAVPAP